MNTIFTILGVSFMVICGILLSMAYVVFIIAIMVLYFLIEYWLWILMLLIIYLILK